MVIYVVCTIQMQVQVQSYKKIGYDARKSIFFFFLVPFLFGGIRKKHYLCKSYVETSGYFSAEKFACSRKNC